MKKLITPGALALMILFSLVSCDSGSSRGGGGGGKTPPKKVSTITSGEINVAVDETFAPIVEAEIESFEYLYEEAKVNATYGPESEAVASFLEGESAGLVLSRKLTDEEEMVVRGKGVVPKETQWATDAIAIVVNNDNKCTYLTQEEVKKIMNGEIKKWSEVDGSYAQEGAKDDIVVVFDHSGSSTARYIKENFVEGEFGDNMFARQNNPEVVDYVSTNPGAIGLIGVNWVSDPDDSTTQDFLEKARVLKIQAPADSEVYQEFFQPYQAYLALEYYPFIRELYFYNREPRNGLGMGFASFIAGDEGQRIVLKSGLLPATMPIRVVEFPAGQ